MEGIVKLNKGMNILASREDGASVAPFILLCFWCKGRVNNLWSPEETRSSKRNIDTP